MPDRDPAVVRLATMLRKGQQYTVTSAASVAIALTASARSSGVKPIKSSIASPWRSYGAGFVGNGCVGEYPSNGCGLLYPCFAGCGRCC